MRIAILGAGLCGLATAAFLVAAKKTKDLEIVIFDPAPLGENASGLSAGLLHSYPGAHAKLVRDATEGQQATLELVNIAEQALGEKIAENTGLLRVAVSPRQRDDFSLCAKQYSDVRWMEAEECQQLVPSLLPNPGIFIETAFIIQTKKYLQGLWTYCSASGVKWEPTLITTLKTLLHFDLIIVATGAAVKSLPELSHLAIKPIKGQMLEIEWPSFLSPLKVPLNSEAYLVMSSDKKRCFVGATFERSFVSSGSDIETAIAYLQPKMLALIPALLEAKILNCYAGLRAATPQHQPVIEEPLNHCWVFSGMGSKGLLYHALYARKLVVNELDLD